MLKSFKKDTILFTFKNGFEHFFKIRYVRMIAILDKQNALTKESAHALLKRDWFIEEDDILDLLDEMSDPVFDYIYDHRDEYSATVRYCIDPSDFKSKMKMKLSVLTDTNFQEIELNRELELNKQIEDAWNTQPKEERPFSQIDDQCDEAWESYQDAKKALDKYLKTKHMTYVPPNLRTPLMTDKKVEELEKEIQTKENEFKALEKQALQEDEEWIKAKKNEFKFKYIANTL
jgi:hypothetical protein